MRLFHVFVVIAAVTGEALTTTADSAQASISKATSPGGTDPRLLRARDDDDSGDDDDDDDSEDDDSEERGLNQFHYDRLDSFGAKLGIDVKKAMNNPSYLARLANERPDALQQYQAKLNALIKANKKKRPSMISNN
jgi:hypothetical protein